MSGLEVDLLQVLSGDAALGAEVAAGDLVDGLEGEDGQDLLQAGMEGRAGGCESVPAAAGQGGSMHACGGDASSMQAITSSFMHALAASQHHA